MLLKNILYMKHSLECFYDYQGLTYQALILNGNIKMSIRTL